METHVKVLAVLYLVFSALGIVLALAFFLATGVVTAIVGTAAEPDAARIAIPIIRLGGTALACFFLALAVPGVVLGIGLLKLQPWARVLGIVVSALTLLHIPSAPCSASMASGSSSPTTPSASSPPPPRRPLGPNTPSVPRPKFAARARQCVRGL
jgi:hypothetical protein